jgi:hypothetical protein
MTILSIGLSTKANDSVYQSFRVSGIRRSKRPNVFLLRDGNALASRLKTAIPLRADQKAALFSRFSDVVRATVKGGILVAIVQGALGGLAFWFLEFMHRFSGRR